MLESYKWYKTQKCVFKSHDVSLCFSIGFLLIKNALAALLHHICCSSGWEIWIFIVCIPSVSTGNIFLLSFLPQFMLHFVFWVKIKQSLLHRFCLNSLFAILPFRCNIDGVSCQPRSETSLSFIQQTTCAACWHSVASCLHKAAYGLGLG